MTIECYHKDCPNHSHQTNKDDGPFCYQDNCTATQEQIIIFDAKREKEIKEWSKDSVLVKK